MPNKLYGELADWWPLLSPPDEYKEEAAFFESLIVKEKPPPNGSMLELGCGGGNVASLLKHRFGQVTLTDISPQMLEVSRSLNPELEHVQGDMRTLRLGRVYDVVFIHDAIDYMTTEQDLRSALETASVHCAPGGFALIVPDHIKEAFEAGTDHGGTDGEERAIRYLEWTYDPDPSDTTYTTDYGYMLREADGQMSLVEDRHILGLFSRDTWLRLLGEVGFTTYTVTDPYEREVFIARKGQ